MRLLKSLALVVVAALVVTACGGGSSSGSNASPSEVAKKFIKATMNFDFAESKQYVASDMLATYNEVYEQVMIQFESPEMKEYLELAKGLTKNVQIEIINEEIDGDNATVTLKMSGVMGMEENEEDLHLVKENGSWKINDAPKM